MGRKLRSGDYNVLPKWFSGNPLPRSMVKSSENDLKKKSITKTTSLEKNASDTKSEDLSADLSTLIYLEESINTYNVDYC